MTAWPHDSALKLGLDSVESGRAPGPSALEREVAALFEELRNPMLRYLLSLGLSPQDAEETIQEGFLALFQHLQRGKSRENLRGWLFRVAHNLGLKRRYSTLRAVGTDSSADERSPDPSPEEQAVSSQTKSRLSAVLQALPEQDRRCLVLRAEGLRYREIASVLEISLG